MQDTELYQRVLGLEAPWRVTSVKLDVKGGFVEVSVEESEVQLPCPICGKACPIYDHTATRSWRHLDTCQFKTVLRARPPRVKCDEHGIHQATLPWAEARSRFTAMFERFAIDVMRETSITGAASILRVSWDEAIGIMHRAVARGLARRKDVPLERIGVDEKAIRKGHLYLTLVTDLGRGAVVWVGSDRKTSTLDAFWATVPPAQRDSIKAVAMDMWDPYYASTVAHLPDGAKKIVYDRFHIMQHATRAVDQVRRNEHFALLREGDRTLDKSRWLWLYNQDNVPERDSERFAALRRVTLKTGKAWLLKEDLRWLWTLPSEQSGRAFIKRWIRWAKSTNLTPIRRLATTISGHVANVVTYFQHRITNAGSESMNALVDKVKTRAAGFRNPENFKTAIYFHCGRLDLYPTLAS